MNLHKMKWMRLIVVFSMLLSIVLNPLTALGSDISDDVEDAVDNISDIEDEMNDLEEEVANTYGTTVLTGDDDISTSVDTATSLKISGGDATWASGESVYSKGSGNTGTTVEIGDTRILPVSTYKGSTTVATGDSDLETDLETSTNLDITGGDATWESTADIYVASGATVAADDTRVSKAKIYSVTQLSTLFNDISSAVEDVADELDDLKGETIPAADLNDLEDAVTDFIDAAENARDEIEGHVHTNLDDDYTNEEDDLADDLDDLEGDLDDVKTGEDTDNKDVDDFTDNINDIQDNVDDIDDAIPSTVSTTTQMQDIIDDLTDEYDDAEDEIDDLAGDEYTDAEQTKINNAWDDLRSSFQDGLDDLEDAVGNADNDTLEDDYDDEKTDFEDDLDSLESKLDDILAGGDGDSGTVSRKVESFLDDLDDYENDVKDQNSLLLKSYGATLQAGDEDVGDTVTVDITAYITGGNDAWVSGEKVYTKGSGNTATTYVEAGDLRVSPFGTTYRASTTVATGDSDIDTAFEASANLYKNGSIYYAADGTPLEAGDIRVNREEIMILSELQSQFDDLGDIMDDVQDDLSSILDEDLTDSEKADIEDDYDSFKDKCEDLIDDIESLVHDTLDDDFDNNQEDYDRDLEDLDNLIKDMNEGTSTTVSDRVTDFVDELSDLEDDIDSKKNSITATYTVVATLTGDFDDLSDILDDVDDEVSNLQGYTFSDSEKSRINDSFDDIQDAIDNAITHIEDKLDSSDEVNDAYDDEESDLNDELDAIDSDLASILNGGGTASKAINDLIEDLKDYKDDIDDVLSDVQGITAGSLNDRNDVRDYSDDVQDALDDAEDALTSFDDEPSSLGVARIKSALDSLETKMDDTMDEMEDKLEVDNDNIEDTFNDEKDDVDAKFDAVTDAAEAIYDKAPADEEEDTEEEGTEEEEIGEVDFSDISSSNVFKDEIEALASIGAINGYSDGSFKPDNTVTRAEFLKIVTGASEADLGETSGDKKFDDVATSNPFYKYIDYASTKGYISGYSDGTFKPYEPITRFEAVVILLRFTGKSVDDISTGSQYFIDVTSPSLAGFTDAAFEQKILSGYQDNTFRPSNNITRGETAKIAVNAFS